MMGSSSAAIAGEYHVRRSRRKREVRKLTINANRGSLRELAQGATLYPEDSGVRPRTRAECEGLMRPCPFVSCKFHLYLDVNTRGGLILNFPNIEPDEMIESCALDVADRGGSTLEQTGEILNLTRERIRQIEIAAGAKIEASMKELLEENAQPRRRRRHLRMVEG